MTENVSSVAVFGTGNWGLTLADVAARSGARVSLYCRREEVYHALLERRQHPEFLPHLVLHRRVVPTMNIAAAAVSSSHWIVVVPSQHLRQLARQLRPWVHKDLQVLSAVKGLEISTHLRMSEVLREEWGDDKDRALGVLGGPNLAFDISQGLPAATAVSCSPEVFLEWTERLGRANLRLYHQPDRIGVELGGALKNVLAIAVGIAHQSGLGESAKAALMTRGLHEMGRLAVRLGAQLTTLAGLSGLGDMVVTASSSHSRNRWCGEQLGKGLGLDQILNSTQMVVEGVPTAYAAQELGQRLGVPLPITDAVVDIFHGTQVSQAVVKLMTRAFVGESDP